LQSHRPSCKGCETRHRICPEMWSAVNVPGVIRWWSLCDALSGVFAEQYPKLLPGK
jgi:hypothetical protein